MSTRTDTRTPTERMWDAAGKLDSARHLLLHAIHDLDGQSKAVHNARISVNALDDAMAVLTEEAGE